MRLYSVILISATGLLLAGCGGTTVVQGPPPPPPQAQPAPAYVSQPEPPPLPSPPAPPPTLAPLDQLCAPIALYPDPLVSLVLPASTFPDQVQAAASYLQGGGDPSGADQMPWDSSVRGLSHYPTVMEWMGANSVWTSQLGGAFASQPAAVMDAIQELRRRAQSVGTLVNSPQQTVVVYQNAVQIIPAQADVIYVPQYDPAVVYVAQPPGFQPAVFYGWSRPYACGAWLSFGFDWHSHAVYTGNWSQYHRMNGGWNRPVNYASISADARFNARGWRPPPNPPPRPPQLSVRANVAVNVNVQARFAQPRPMAGAPPPPAGAVRIHAIEQNRPGGGGRPAPMAQAQHPQPQGGRPPQSPATHAGQRPVAPGEQARTAQEHAAQAQRTQQPPQPPPPASAQTQQQREQQQQQHAQQAAQQQKAQQLRAQQQAQQHQQATAQQQKAKEDQARQADAQRRQPEAQKPQPAASHPQPQAQEKKPQPKQPPKKPAPKKTPEEIEREKKAQEAAEHPPS